MNNTTGWRKVNGGLRKLIDYQYYHVKREHGGAWWDLYIVDKGLTFLTDRPTLRECQILAHTTARLWAGDTE